MGMKATRAIALGLLAAAHVTASCGLKRRHRCTATTEYLGQPRVGRGDDFNDEAKAKEFARKDICPSYCESHDPIVEKAYLAGRNPKEQKSHVERINVIANVPAVKTAFETCKSTCSGALSKATFTYECEYSGI